MAVQVLNELCQLSESLKKAGIQPQDWQKDFKPLPNASVKKPCYKIVLGSEGTVVQVEILKPETVGILRKWEPSNGHSFPGMNIQPLYRIAEEDQKKLLKKWRDGKESVDVTRLKAWCLDENKNWDQKALDKVQKCLSDIPQLLLSLLGDIPTEFEAIKHLIRSAETFQRRETLEKYVWAELEAGTDVSTLMPILVHEGNEAKAADKDRGRLSVFLDIKNWTHYPVAHEKTMRFLNKRLLLQRTSTLRKSSAVDAYGVSIGDDDGKEKMPDVKLRVLGGVRLRAMNRESSCQFRYGTIDSSSFPAGQESRKHAKGALEWLGSAQLEGLTWGRVTAREVLFAYPSEVPPSPPSLASILGARKEGDNSARFAEYAKDVIVQLKGLNRDLEQVELHVFSLRKMDKARTKVVFHRNYSADRLAIASADWQEGCENIPPIHIPTWGDNKGETIIATPETPFPLHLAACLNRVWKMDGSTECALNVIAPTSGVELLLDTKNRRHVARLLSVAIKNGKGLFISMGHALNRGERIPLKGLDMQKQLMPSILGLLLHKGSIRKERYMMNTPYLVGNMLKVSDDLHGLYCKEVRGGKLPPQLLGNALMAAALQSPIQALSQLASRIPPYLGWARTNRTDHAGLSRYFMKCYSEIESKLKGQTLPSRLNDEERAQLLLGYLASSERSQSNKEQGGEE